MASRASACEAPRRPFRIYVLDLGGDRLYVGSTAKPVEERAREHRAERGRERARVRRDLTPEALCATREEAEGVERRLAKSLRRRGWEVEQS